MEVFTTQIRLALGSETPVSTLQELLQKKGLTPHYELIHNGVGTQDPLFKFRVSAEEETAIGDGKSKKEAKNNAAAMLLKKLLSKNCEKGEEIISDQEKIRNGTFQHNLSLRVKDLHNVFHLRLDKQPLPLVFKELPNRTEEFIDCLKNPVKFLETVVDALGGVVTKNHVTKEEYKSSLIKMAELLEDELSGDREEDRLWDDETETNDGVEENVTPQSATINIHHILPDYPLSDSDDEEQIKTDNVCEDISSDSKTCEKVHTSDSEEEEYRWWDDKSETNDGVEENVTPRSARINIHHILPDYPLSDSDDEEQIKTDNVSEDVSSDSKTCEKVQTSDSEEEEYRWWEDKTETNDGVEENVTPRSARINIHHILPDYPLSDSDDEEQIKTDNLSEDVSSDSKTCEKVHTSDSEEEEYRWWEDETDTNDGVKENVILQSARINIHHILLDYPLSDSDDEEQIKTVNVCEDISSDSKTCEKVHTSDSEEEEYRWWEDKTETNDGVEENVTPRSARINIHHILPDYPLSDSDDEEQIKTDNLSEDVSSDSKTCEKVHTSDSEEEEYRWWEDKTETNDGVEENVTPQSARINIHHILPDYPLSDSDDEEQIKTDNVSEDVSSDSKTCEKVQTSDSEEEQYRWWEDKTETNDGVEENVTSQSARINIHYILPDYPLSDSDDEEQIKTDNVSEDVSSDSKTCEKVHTSDFDEEEYRWWEDKTETNDGVEENVTPWSARINIHHILPDYPLSDSDDEEQIKTDNLSEDVSSDSKTCEKVQTSDSEEEEYRWWEDKTETNDGVEENVTPQSARINIHYILPDYPLSDSDDEEQIKTDNVSEDVSSDSKTCEKVQTSDSEEEEYRWWEDKTETNDGVEENVTPRSARINIHHFLPDYPLSDSDDEEQIKTDNVAFNGVQEDVSSDSKTCEKGYTSDTENSVFWSFIKVEVPLGRWEFVGKGRSESEAQDEVARQAIKFLRLLAIPPPDTM